MKKKEEERKESSKRETKTENTKVATGKGREVTKERTETR